MRRLDAASYWDVPSEWNVAVLLGRILVSLGAQRVERIDEPWARLARIDDVVDEPPAGRDVRVRELRTILFQESLRLFLGAAARRYLLAIENLNGALRPHDRD